MPNILSAQEKSYILSQYKDRKMTIRELSKRLSKDYTTVRMYLVSQGYSNGKVR